MILESVIFFALLLVTTMVVALFPRTINAPMWLSIPVCLVALAAAAGIFLVVQHDGPGMSLLVLVADRPGAADARAAAALELPRRAALRRGDRRLTRLPGVRGLPDVPRQPLRRCGDRVRRPAHPRGRRAAALDLLHLRDRRRAGAAHPGVPGATADADPVGGPAGAVVQRARRGGAADAGVARQGRLPQPDDPGGRQQHHRPRGVEAAGTALQGARGRVSPSCTSRTGRASRRARSTRPPSTCRSRSRSSASSTPTTAFTRAGCRRPSGTSTTRRWPSCRPRSTTATGRTTATCAASSTASATSSTSPCRRAATATRSSSAAPWG